MEKEIKSTYVAPSIEVIPMETESVIATSGFPGSDNTPTETRSYRSTRSYNGASSGDLEDLINDILTVEQ